MPAFYCTLIYLLSCTSTFLFVNMLTRTKKKNKCFNMTIGSEKRYMETRLLLILK